MEGGLRKLLFCAPVLAVFIKLFFFSWDLPWQFKYQLFNVPAMPLPGGDARNIQVMAYCSRQGVPYFGDSECLRSAIPLQARHPDASVPVLNYPSLWVKVYSFFRDDSEQFFLRFWTLNALLLVAGILICCLKYNCFSLPALLFSPVTLFAIERGNIDAAMYFFTFVPLLAFSSSRPLQSFCLGIASALKIFPFFGYVAFLRTRPPFVAGGAVLGALFAAPLIAMSFLEIPQMIRGTTQGFVASYGLSSLQHSAFLNRQTSYAHLAATVFLIFWAVSLLLLLRTRRLNQSIDSDLGRLASNDIVVLLVSCGIYVFTFLTFVNYAYRLIFLLPAFLVVSNLKSIPARLICLNIVVVLWIPLAPYPHGWMLQNLSCFPLAIGLSYLGARAIMHGSLKDD